MKWHAYAMITTLWKQPYPQMDKNKKETCKNEKSFCIRLELSPYLWDKRTREVLPKNFQYGTSCRRKKRKVGSSSQCRRCTGALTTTAARLPRWCHHLLETEAINRWVGIAQEEQRRFLQTNRYRKAQWFILLTGSWGSLWVAGDPGTILVRGRVHSWKMGVEDVVAPWSASLTGGSTAHVLLGSGAGVDVIGVSSVFPFLGVPGAITVNNSWETEKALSELDSWRFPTAGKLWLILEDFKAIFLFYEANQHLTTSLVGGIEWPMH